MFISYVIGQPLYNSTDNLNDNVAMTSQCCVSSADTIALAFDMK